MLKDKPMGKTISLAAHRALSGARITKTSLSPREEGASNSGGLQGHCEVMQAENLKSQSQSRT